MLILKTGEWISGRFGARTTRRYTDPEHRYNSRKNKSVPVQQTISLNRINSMLAAQRIHRFMFETANDSKRFQYRFPLWFWIIFQLWFPSCLHVDNPLTLQIAMVYYGEWVTSINYIFNPFESIMLNMCSVITTCNTELITIK